MGWLNTIAAFFKYLWKELVKLGHVIMKKILYFTKNIAEFFKNPKRWTMLKANKKILPIVIREKLKNGGYNTISCLFDEEKDDVVNIEEDAQGFECERLDSELSNYFGDKDMIILR